MESILKSFWLDIYYYDQDDVTLGYFWKKHNQLGLRKNSGSYTKEINVSRWRATVVLKQIFHIFEKFANN